MAAYEVVALSTLQFADGGLFDSKPVGHDIHLIRATRRGTPGPCLCGQERPVSSGPGWSVGGGVSDPEAKACAGCVEVADREYPGLPVWGSMFGGLFEREPSPWDYRHLELSYPWDSDDDGIERHVGANLG